MKRQKYETRVITLSGELQRSTLRALTEHLPIDKENPIEAVFREKVKARKPDQNSAMWSGPLKDIAEQAYIMGRHYSAPVWHEHFKILHLPEQYDPELCKSEDYRKWDFTPGGRRVLVGSTTDLTIKGFALYMQQLEADGANMGVMFHANPHELRRAA